jgi:List-Bact-rpt repeat protein
MPPSQPIRSVAIGHSVITVGVPGGTLITAGTRLSADADVVDPAELEAALAQEETLGELAERSVISASEATDRVEQAADLLSDALAGRLVDLDRAGQVLDVLQRLDEDGRYEEWLRYARSVHGVLVLYKRWVELLRLLRTLLGAGDRVNAAGRAWAQHELGTLHLAAGHQKEAARLLEQARSTRERLGDAEGLAATEQSLGVLCRRQASGGSTHRGRIAALLAVALLLLMAGVVAGAVADPFGSDPDPARLAVAVDGPGRVTGPDISCPDSCEAEVDPDTRVTLTASTQGGSSFEGWSGGGCQGTGPCELTVRDDVTVTARFAAAQATEFPLTVTLDGEGGGQVTSRPAGIDCGDDCDARFDDGTDVELLQQADDGSVFTGWSGAGCSGTGGCTVTMTRARTVTAAFGPAEPTRFILTTSTAGGGELAPPCAQGCPYEEGSQVTLTATPAGENNTVAWEGCTPATPGDTTCVVTMSENRDVTATFSFTEPEIP